MKDNEFQFIDTITKLVALMFFFWVFILLAGTAAAAYFVLR